MITITILRGTHQIGGCITEIKTETARIVIDMGEELPGSKSDGVFEVEGVTIGKADCDAVFITHYHADHIGHYAGISPDIPVYIGEVAKEIFLTLVSYLRSDGVGRIKAFRTFRALEKIVVKDITVTPLLVDHSAFDAYMFLIEGGGKRILHTGDFRLLGFRGNAVIPTLKKYAVPIDILISEGTSLSREHKQSVKESELLVLARRSLCESKYAFVLCSSTNIDRIAVFYHALPKGKYFVCDDYQKQILEVVTSRAREKTSLYNFSDAIVYNSSLDEELADRGFCMLVRSGSYFRRIMEKFPGAAFLYSMWEGYANGIFKNEAVSLLTSKFGFVPFHTSGHLSKDDIEAVCNCLQPSTGIIPIHSDAPEEIDSLDICCPIIHLHDNEPFIV